jgi:hypothetical protein
MPAVLPKTMFLIASVKSSTFPRRRISPCRGSVEGSRPSDLSMRFAWTNDWRMQPSDPLGILIAEGRMDTVVTASKRAYGCLASLISMSAYWLHADQ